MGMEFVLVMKYSNQSNPQLYCSTSFSYTVFFFFLYQNSHSCIHEKIVGMMCQAKTYSSLHFFAWPRSPQVMVGVILEEL